MIRSNVDDLAKESRLEAQKRLGLFNPMYESFDFEYLGKEYSLKAQEITRLPASVAKYAAKHLRDAVVNYRNYSEPIPEARKKAMKEILV